MTYLSGIYLRNFRNYTHVDLVLTPGLQVLQGANGAGKTNILEAVHCLSILRSFRTTQWRYLKKNDADSFRIGADLVPSWGGGTNSITTKLEVHFVSGRRSFYVDRRRVAKASEYVNRFFCTAFVPEDIQMIKGSPAERRRYVNVLLTQVQPDYMYHLQRYKYAVMERNAALQKIEKYGQRTISAYDRILAEHGCAVAMARRRLVNEVEGLVNDYFNMLSQNSGKKLTLRYKSNVKTVLDAPAEDALTAYTSLLHEHVESDKESGCTGIGPHRDDVVINLDGRSIRAYASEGECRLAALSLKLGALALRKRCEQNEIVLVDDVLGELDADRRKAFFGVLGTDKQILVAVTEFPECLNGKAERVISVKNGEIA